jgi:hypothetical protein
MLWRFNTIDNLRYDSADFQLHYFASRLQFFTYLLQKAYLQKGQYFTQIG